MPSFYGSEVSLHWMDLVLPVALGGLWVAAFAWQAKKRPLLPLQDPNLRKAMEEAQAA